MEGVKVRGGKVGVRGSVGCEGKEGESGGGEAKRVGVLVIHRLINECVHVYLVNECARHTPSQK